MGKITWWLSYLSMRSHRKSNVWTASSLSSLSGSQLSQWGRISLTLTHSGRNLMTFPTAEMQFSVAFTFSLERESAAWMTLTSRGMASEPRKQTNTSCNRQLKAIYCNVMTGDLDCTCTEWAIVLSSILSHNTNTVGGGLPNLGARVTQWLQHRPQEILCIFERWGATVLHHIIKNAQTPLSVCPRPVGTLEQMQTSYCLSMWCAL